MKKLCSAFALLTVSAGLCGLAARPAAAAARPAQPKVIVNQALFSRDLKSPDWVRTPDGLIYRTCVHHVPRGSVFDGARDQITGPHGAVTRFAPCPHPRLLPSAPPAHGPSGHPAATGFPLNGWQQDSWWDENAPLPAVLGTEYTVPLAPAASGSTDYLFSSFENTNSIIQPVIGYGPTSGSGGSQYGGNYMWEQSYYVDTDNNAAVGDNHQITPGDKVFGVMRARQCQSSGGDCTWDIVTDDLTSGQSSEVSIAGDDNPYNSVQGGVLEVYGVNSCDQLFAGGHAAFSDITVLNQDNSLARPAFRLTSPEPQCSLRTSATPDSTDISWNNS